MRNRPRAARPAGGSAASSGSAASKLNSLHLANSFDRCRGRRMGLVSRQAGPGLQRHRRHVRTHRGFGEAIEAGMLDAHDWRYRRCGIPTRPCPLRPPSNTARQRGLRSAKGGRGCTRVTHPLVMMSAAGIKGSTLFGGGLADIAILPGPLLWSIVRCEPPWRAEVRDTRLYRRACGPDSASRLRKAGMFSW